MKRLIFCFDGTWNRLDAANTTNVVITAETVLPLAPDRTAQLIFYDEGVGTDKNETFRGGMFGSGLVKNLADGYRFLIFNYTPGDQIYVFGFSRGAYTARSFVGLLNVCGILLRKHASKVNEAIELYKQRKTSPAFLEKMRCFRCDHSPEVCSSDEEQAWRIEYLRAPGLTLPRLQIAYLGVWDTVGALGIPARYKLGSWLNKKHEFHDTALSPFVKSARHAVAIDERKKDFQPTLWDNLEELNRQANVDPAAVDAPYQEMWFPGVHGSIGGGGKRRGLSDQTLDWILDGARATGLVLDSSIHSRIYEFQPDYREYLDNSEQPSLAFRLMNRFVAADRQHGPQKIHQVSMSARRRWLEDAKNLPDKKQYRPPSLVAVANALDQLNSADYGLGATEDVTAEAGPYEVYEVKRGDTLRELALRRYGRAEDYLRILKANLNKIDHPNRIYPGQLLRIPQP